MTMLITRAGVVITCAALAFALAPESSRMQALLAGLLAGLVAVAAEEVARRASPRAVLGAAVGLICGLSVAVLASLTVFPWIADKGLTVTTVAPVLLAVVCAHVGLTVGARHGATFAASQSDAATVNVPHRIVRPPPAPGYTSPKVMDTSVIIDGRVCDVIGSGFMEGTLVVPQFVLRELQQVADSSDPLKRNRGRKGLDILKAIQDSERVRVEVTDRDYPDVKEVDGKLLVLAEELGAKILTNDYNLNKVAQLRGVPVLNVNDLANAMKPVVLPGEMLALQVIKEGKERNQGVGYLDDGTMVVVDNGKRIIGQKVDVVVTSVIQTNAGKMIFAQTADDPDAAARPRVASRAPRDAVATTIVGQG